MKETFKSRFGLIVALIGMAVGTGNIWRFPRVMAANGGGAFLIPWFLFLFLWSIPLLMIEFSLGQKLRKGVTASFSELTGGRFAWLGAFVTFCTLGIMFYYSVVTGWCLYYLGKSVSGGLFATDSQVLWNQFIDSKIWPLGLHGFVIALVVVVLSRGVRKGIERISVIMIPTLFVILMGLAIYSMSLSGKSQALSFIFNTDFSKLLHYKVWLEGLTQSAWSTGAGWGVALSYACYARSKDHPVLTPFTTGFGNNSIELLAAMAVLIPLFSFFSMSEVLDLTSKGNTGLTFIALPGLFKSMPAGKWVAILFFVALFFAAFTSLVSMFEVGIRYFQDMGWKRGKSILFLALLCFIIGTPSALHMKFFENQDWVWGVGLLLSGFFFSLLFRHVGARSFCQEYLPIKKFFHRKVFQIIVLWFIPIQFLALLIWWFYQSVKWDPSGWWNPFNALSIGTCLLQWVLLLFALLILNSKIAGWTRRYTE